MKLVKVIKVTLDSGESASLLARCCRDPESDCTVGRYENCPFEGIACDDVSVKHWRQIIRGSSTVIDTSEKK